MNDYLHNLVARTLQRSPLVRPRLPSLFEPMAAGQTVNASAPFETSEGAASTRPTPEVFRTNVRPPGQERGPATFETVSRPTTAKTVDGEIGKDRGAPSRALPRMGELTVATPQIVVPVASQMMGPEAPSIRRLIAQAAHPVPNSSTESAASEAQANGLSEQPRLEARVTALPGEERSRDRRKPAEAAATRGLEFRPTRPSMRHVQGERFATQQADPFSGTDTTPTINVTIGRVDVRAVFPQTPVKPARRAHPAPMSLDEYLKQRSEGGK